MINDINIEAEEAGNRENILSAPQEPGPDFGPQERKRNTEYRDFTSEFDSSDIRENKVFAMGAYALSFAGIIVALLAAGGSGFVRFHVKEALKISVVEAVVFIVTLLLCWTFIVPIAGSVATLLMLIAKAIGFVNACKGKAVPAFIVRDIPFLN